MFKVSSRVWGYLGIATCFWEDVTFEHEKTAFLFYLQDILFFSSECLVNSACLPQSDLTKMMMPRTATHLSFFNSNGLVLINWTLPISLNISKSWICCTSTPQRELKILWQEKTTSQAIKPYLLKVLEEMKIFAFRDHSFWLLSRSHENIKDSS